jgi:hypothetical protein
LQRAWLCLIAVSLCSCSGSGNPDGAGGAGGTAARDGGIHFTGGAGGRGDAAVETPGAVDAQARAVLTIGTKYVVSLGDVMLAAIVCGGSAREGQSRLDWLSPWALGWST